MVTLVTVVTVRDALIALQKRKSLTDTQMAALLGCSRPYWNLIRNGKRAFPREFAIRAAGVWPELTRYLLDMAEESASPVANTPQPAAEVA